jgi:hypothetical protein
VGNINKGYRTTPYSKSYEKTILGALTTLTLLALGLVYINYNNASFTNIPKKETNTPKLYYHSSLTELTSPSKKGLPGKNQFSYRQPPRLLEPKSKNYQLPNQRKVDQLLPNIDKSTFQTKYIKKAITYLFIMPLKFLFPN